MNTLSENISHRYNLTRISKIKSKEVWKNVTNMHKRPGCISDQWGSKNKNNMLKFSIILYILN